MQEFLKSLFSSQKEKVNIKYTYTQRDVYRQKYTYVKCGNLRLKWNLSNDVLKCWKCSYFNVKYLFFISAFVKKLPWQLLIFKPFSSYFEKETYVKISTFPMGQGFWTALISVIFSSFCSNVVSVFKTTAVGFLSFRKKKKHGLRR